MPMMQVAVAGSNFKEQNLSKRTAEVKTLKNYRRDLAASEPPKTSHGKGKTVTSCSNIPNDFSYRPEKTGSQF
jgi:hypothetical protein